MYTYDAQNRYFHSNCPVNQNENDKIHNSNITNTIFKDRDGKQLNLHSLACTNEIHIHPSN